MTRAHWLLDVEIDGRPYRWSVQAVTVTTDAGDELEYAPGLEDLVAAEGDEPEVSVTDPSVDWPTMAERLECRACTLRRWVEGDVFELATVYATGEVFGVSWGTEDEPVTWRIAAIVGGPSLGQQVPDPLARVDATTWPVTALHEVGSEGATYPVVLGYPGYISEGVVAATMPVPLAQFLADTAATTYAVVSEDEDAQITSVLVRVDEIEAESDEDVGLFPDLLGRLVRVLDFSADDEIMPPSPTSTIYVGFSPDGGGGVARNAYDVLVYLLRRWGPESADWTRLPEVRDALGTYMVDTWIDQPAPNPWVVFEPILADLPFEVRTSARGRYLVHRRYVSDPTRVVGSLDADLGEATRISAVGRESAPVNEFVALFRNSIHGDWLGRVVLTGSPSALASAPRYALPPSSTSQRVTIAQHQRCLDSYSRWGLRQAGEPIQIDWTWDTGTVLACLEWRALRDAVPAILVDYEIEDDEELREGDELLLTDSELGWSEVAAIVDAPPVRGELTTVTLRLPEVG